MRDVLSLVNGILCANSLAAGLSQGLPRVLQQHMAGMEQQVKQQLAPTATAPGASQLEGQVRQHDDCSAHAQACHTGVLCCALGLQ